MSLLLPLGTFALLALALGFALALAAICLRRQDDPVVEAIDAVLPQTQCGQCGYPGCRPYAEAIARGEADIDRCPPGGEEGVRALARLLGREPKPLAVGGSEQGLVAIVDEARCIGCTLCIQACPVDAIVGAPKRMHQVIAELCTGCALCLPPCPVDCIALRPRAQPWRPPPPAIRGNLDARR